MTFLPRRIATLAIASSALFGVVLPTTQAGATAIPAPTLTGPADSATTPIKDVVLQWDQVAGASGYQVQISPNGAWTNNTVTLPNNGLTAATVYDVPLSLPHATYWWRVRAQVGSTWGPYSSPERFRHDWEGTSTALTTPSDVDPTITWTPIPDASEYLVRISTDRDFPTDSNKTFNCFTNATSFTPYTLDSAKETNAGSCFGEPQLTNDTLYYWYVEALDDSSAPIMPADTTNDPNWDCDAAQPECNSSAGRPGGQFTFEAPVAGTPAEGGLVTGLATTWHSTSVPGTACNSSTACPTTPTFSWDPYPGANFYKVHVYWDADGTNTYRAYDTAWPELTPRDSYLDANAGTAFYWTVEAGTCENSATDKTCAKTDTSATSCTTGAGTSAPTISGLAAVPAGPSGSQSANGGTTVTVTLTGTNFTSTPSEPCVDASGGSVEEDTVNVVNPTTLTFTFDTPTASGPVTFDVVNADGSQSNTSDPLQIKGPGKVKMYADSLPSSFDKSSGTVSLGAPANGADLHGRAVTFSWSDFLTSGAQGSYDARNYDVQVATDPDFTNTVIDNSKVDLTQYTDPSALFSDGTYYWRVAPIDESGNALTWSSTRTFTIDASGPSVRISSHNGVSVKGPITIRFSHAVSGVSNSTVRVVPGSGSTPVAGRLTIGSSPTIYEFRPTSPLVTGEVYQLSVSPTLVDNNGNPVVVVGGGVRTATVATGTSPAWAFSSGWTKHNASGARSGSYKSARAGHSAHLRVAGSKAVLYGCKSPHMGSITVTVAGHSQRISEHQSFTRCGVLLWSKALPKGEPTITVTVAHGVGNIDEVKVS